MALFALADGLKEWGPYLVSIASALAVGTHLLQQRRTNVWAVVEEQKKIAATHEETIKLLQVEIQRLTVLSEDTRRDSFNNAVLCEKLKEENRRLGVKILDQQEEIDALRLVVAQHEKVAEDRREADDRRRGA